MHGLAPFALLYISIERSESPALSFSSVLLHSYLLAFSLSLSFSICFSLALSLEVCWFGAALIVGSTVCCVVHLVCCWFVVLLFCADVVLLFY